MYFLIFVFCSIFIYKIIFVLLHCLTFQFSSISDLCDMHNGELGSMSVLWLISYVTLRSLCYVRYVTFVTLRYFTYVTFVTLRLLRYVRYVTFVTLRSLRYVSCGAGSISRYFSFIISLEMFIKQRIKLTVGTRVSCCVTQFRAPHST